MGRNPRRPSLVDFVTTLVRKHRVQYKSSHGGVYRRLMMNTIDALDTFATGWVHTYWDDICETDQSSFKVYDDVLDALSWGENGFISYIALALTLDVLVHYVPRHSPQLATCCAYLLHASASSHHHHSLLVATSIVLGPASSPCPTLNDTISVACDSFSAAATFAYVRDLADSFAIVSTKPVWGVRSTSCTHAQRYRHRAPRAAPTCGCCGASPSEVRTPIYRDTRLASSAPTAAASPHTCLACAIEIALAAGTAARLPLHPPGPRVPPSASPGHVPWLAAAAAHLAAWALPLSRSSTATDTQCTPPDAGAVAAAAAQWVGGPATGGRTSAATTAATTIDHDNVTPSAAGVAAATMHPDNAAGASDYATGASTASSPPPPTSVLAAAAAMLRGVAVAGQGWAAGAAAPLDDVPLSPPPCHCCARLARACSRCAVCASVDLCCTAASPTADIRGGGIAVGGTSHHGRRRAASAATVATRRRVVLHPQARPSTSLRRRGAVRRLRAATLPAVPACTAARAGAAAPACGAGPDGDSDQSPLEAAAAALAVVRWFVRRRRTLRTTAPWAPASAGATADVACPPTRSGADGGRPIGPRGWLRGPPPPHGRIPHGPPPPWSVLGAAPHGSVRGALALAVRGIAPRAPRGRCPRCGADGDLPGGVVVAAAAAAAVAAAAHVHAAAVACAAAATEWFLSTHSPGSCGAAAAPSGADALAVGGSVAACAVGAAGTVPDRAVGVLSESAPLACDAAGAVGLVVTLAAHVEARVRAAVRGADYLEDGSYEGGMPASGRSRSDHPAVRGADAARYRPQGIPGPYAAVVRAGMATVGSVMLLAGMRGAAAPAAAAVTHCISAAVAAVVAALRESQAGAASGARQMSVGCDAWGGLPHRQSDTPGSRHVMAVAAAGALAAAARGLAAVLENAPTALRDGVDAAVCDMVDAAAAVDASAARRAVAAAVSGDAADSAGYDGAAAAASLDLATANARVVVDTVASVAAAALRAAHHDPVDSADDPAVAAAGAAASAALDQLTFGAHVLPPLRRDPRPHAHAVRVVYHMVPRVVHAAAAHRLAAAGAPSVVARGADTYARPCGGALAAAVAARAATTEPSVALMAWGAAPPTPPSSLQPAPPHQSRATLGSSCGAADLPVEGTGHQPQLPAGHAESCLPLPRIPATAAVLSAPRACASAVRGASGAHVQACSCNPQSPPSRPAAAAATDTDEVIAACIADSANLTSLSIAPNASTTDREGPAVAAARVVERVAALVAAASGAPARCAICVYDEYTFACVKYTPTACATCGDQLVPAGVADMGTDGTNAPTPTTSAPAMLRCATTTCARVHTAVPLRLPLPPLLVLRAVLAGGGDASVVVTRATGMDPSVRRAVRLLPLCDVAAVFVAAASLPPTPPVLAAYAAAVTRVVAAAATVTACASGGRSLMFVLGDDSRRECVPGPPCGPTAESDPRRAIFTRAPSRFVCVELGYQRGRAAAAPDDPATCAQWLGVDTPSTCALGHPHGASRRCDGDGAGGRPPPPLPSPSMRSYAGSQLTGPAGCACGEFIVELVARDAVHMLKAWGCAVPLCRVADGVGRLMAARGAGCFVQHCSLREVIQTVSRWLLAMVDNGHMGLSRDLHRPAYVALRSQPGHEFNQP